MEENTPTLHMMCGKIASGKSSLSAQLSAQDSTILISEDTWLHGLYDDQLTSMPDYMRAMSKFRSIIGPHVIALLQARVSVVLDFQANTLESRHWMRGIVEQTQAAHVMHVLDVPDDVCLARLRRRNASGEHPFAVTEEQFHRVSAHFVLPTEEEGFDILWHSYVDGG